MQAVFCYFWSKCHFEWFKNSLISSLILRFLSINQKSILYSWVTLPMNMNMNTFIHSYVDWSDSDLNIQLCFVCMIVGFVCILYDQLSNPQSITGCISSQKVFRLTPQCTVNKTFLHFNNVHQFYALNKLVIKDKNSYLAKFQFKQEMFIFFFCCQLWHHAKRTYIQSRNWLCREVMFQGHNSDGSASHPTNIPYIYKILRLYTFTHTDSNIYCNWDQRDTQRLFSNIWLNSVSITIVIIPHFPY